jgi:RHS repeat-associated protein
VPAGEQGQARDGVLADADQPGGLADAAAIGEVSEDGQELVLRQVGAEQGRALALGEAGAAGGAVQQAVLVVAAVAHADGEVSAVTPAVVGAVGVETAEAAEVVQGKRSYEKDVTGSERLDAQDGKTVQPFRDTTGFRYRDLLPALGRWVRIDPTGFSAGDVNLYRAVDNSPVGVTDPMGLSGDSGWSWVNKGAEYTAQGLDKLTGGISTSVLTNETVGNIIDATDSFFAGWSHSLTGGMSSAARTAVYGDTATNSHSGGWFTAGKVVGIFHNAAMIVAGGAQAVSGFRALGSGGGALALIGGGEVALANVPALVATGEGILAVGYGTWAAMNASNNPQGSGNTQGQGGGGGGKGLSEHDIKFKQTRFNNGLEDLQEAERQLKQTTDVQERNRLQQKIGQLEEMLEKLAIELEPYPPK